MPAPLGLGWREGAHERPCARVRDMLRSCALAGLTEKHRNSVCEHSEYTRVSTVSTPLPRVISDLTEKYHNSFQKMWKTQCKSSYRRINHLFYWCARSRCRCGRGEPSPGADVGGVSPVPVQMWAG